MATLLFTDERMVGHNPGPGHPERPDRLRSVIERLRDEPIDGAVVEAPPSADPAWLHTVHDAAYVERILGLEGQRVSLDPDTHLSERSIEAARLSAGAAVAAVDAICSGRADNAFALGRPPGHHAERAQAMGFCLFNNVAIAAERALREHGLSRVLIIDWDVHHGNGTQHAFYDRDDVLFFSTHQFPFYPGTGAIDEIGRGAGSGYTINAPMRGGMGNGDATSLFQQILEPVSEAFEPELVLVSAGFDAHRDDPLGGMRLTATGFAALCAIARRIAERHADGRLALILEGGYHLEALADSAHACASVLAGYTPDHISDTPTTGALVRRLRERLSPYWTM